MKTPLGLLAAAAAAGLAIALPLTAAAGQKAAPAPPSAHGRRQESLKQITDRVSQETGLRVVVADPTLSRETVSAPETSVTKDTVEEYLTMLARRVSSGALVVKVYLPPSTPNRRFTPAAIEQTALAQLALLGRPAPNTVQIQGKTLSSAEAEPIIRTLGLEPVYVLTTRRAQPFGIPSPGAAGGASLSTTVDPQRIMGDLAKQLGVNNVSDIPTGSYKVNVVGPDGVSREAMVDVESKDGSRQVRVTMHSDTVRSEPTAP